MLISNLQIFEFTVQVKEKIVLQVMQEPQHVAEGNNESEGDSEYEDAEDGIPPPHDSSHTPPVTNFECRICGESVATKYCKECKDTFCAPCDGLYHKHVARQYHVRTELVMRVVSPSRQQPVAGSAVGAATAVTAGATVVVTAGAGAAAVTAGAGAAAAAAMVAQQSHGAAASSATATASDETRYD